MVGWWADMNKSRTSQLQKERLVIAASAASTCLKTFTLWAFQDMWLRIRYLDRYTRIGQAALLGWRHLVWCDLLCDVVWRARTLCNITLTLKYFNALLSISVTCYYLIHRYRCCHSLQYTSAAFLETTARVQAIQTRGLRLVVAAFPCPMSHI